MSHLPESPFFSLGPSSREESKKRRDRFRTPLKIRTPKVDEASRVKWHGMPPTPLATARTWRPKGTLAF